MNRIHTLVFILLIGNSCLAQNLSLQELTSLCNKPSWESVDDYLVNKGWEYYSSEKGQTNEYSTITWTYQKEIWSDKAVGWFFLYSYDNKTDKILMQFHNVNTYKTIKNSLNTGYKLISSDILDETITAEYANDMFTITLVVNQTDDDDYSDNSKSIYFITIIRKQGVYDEDNGFKQYYNNGELFAEVNLKDGKFNGLCKFYYTSDGTLKMQGNYLNDEKNGKFIEYDYDGSLSEYTYVKGLLNGPYTIYYLNGNKKIQGNLKNGEKNGRVTSFSEDGSKEAEITYLNGIGNGPFVFYYSNGKIRMSGNYENDELDGLIREFDEGGNLTGEYYKKSGTMNGKFIAYSYNDENVLTFKSQGNYLDGMQDGKWEYFIFENNKPELIGYKTYSLDELDGPYYYFSGDSIIVTNYDNGLLNGNHLVYYDLGSWLLGGVPKDTANCVLISNGNYKNGLKNGFWKEYSISGQLLREGNYNENLEEGKWTYYFDMYTGYKSDNSLIAPWSGMLYLEENYKKGKLNGEVKRFAYLEEIEEPCLSVENDTCTTTIMVKRFESLNYINDILQGEYLLKDSNNVIITKGWYSKGQRDSFWFMRVYNEADTVLINTSYNYGLLNGKTDFYNSDSILTKTGYFDSDLRSGIWKEYDLNQNLLAEYSYKLGKIDGKVIEYFTNGKIKRKCEYTNDILKSLVEYDSIGDLQLNIAIKNVTTDYFWFTSESIDEHFNTLTTYRMSNAILNDTSWIEPIRFSILISINLWDPFSYNICKDGEYALKDLRGSLLEIGNYSCDSLNGEYIKYFENQNLKQVLNYDNGLIISEHFLDTYVEKDFSGILSIADTNGMLLQEIKIKNGRRNGKTKYFNSLGKVEKVEKYENGVLE